MISSNRLRVSNVPGAAKVEEKRLEELQKTQQYLRSGKPQTPSTTDSHSTIKETRRCHQCHKIGHIASDCWQ